MPFSRAGTHVLIRVSGINPWNSVPSNRSMIDADNVYLSSTIWPAAKTATIAVTTKTSFTNDKRLRKTYNPYTMPIKRLRNAPRLAVAMSTLKVMSVIV